MLMRNHTLKIKNKYVSLPGKFGYGYQYIFLLNLITLSISLLVAYNVFQVPLLDYLWGLNLLLILIPLTHLFFIGSKKFVTYDEVTKSQELYKKAYLTNNKVFANNMHRAFNCMHYDCAQTYAVFKRYEDTFRKIKMSNFEIYQLIFEYKFYGPLIDSAELTKILQQPNARELLEALSKEREPLLNEAIAKEELNEQKEIKKDLQRVYMLLGKNK